MTIVERTRRVALAAGFALAVGGAGAGCGAEETSESSQAGESSEGVETTQSALLEGLRIGADPAAPNEEQSESTSIVQDSTGIAYTAFNGDDPAHLSYPTTTSRKICKNTSLATYVARNTSGNFGSLGRIPVPFGIAVNWGDPASAYVNGSVFLSQLTSPTDMFNSVSGNQNCWTNPHNGSAEAMLAGACIFQSTSQTTSPTFSASVACLRTGNDFYDGGSMSGGGAASTTVMAAFMNVTQGRIDVWRGPSPSWTKTATPFAGKSMDGHPLVLGGYTVVAPDTSGNLWITNYHASNNTWSTPVSVGGSVADSLHINGGQLIRQVGYSAALGGPTGVNVPPTAYIVYSKVVNSFVQVRVSTCTINTSTGDFASCADLASAASSASAHAYLPSIALAHVGASPAPFTDVEARISYWSDQGLSGNQIQLRSINLANPTVVAVARPQTACPDARGYMGDYDDTYVINDFSLNPMFVRPYTDSTDSACAQQEFTSVPQHVSVWTLGVTDYAPITLNSGWTNAPFSTRNAAISVNGGIVRMKGAIATTGTNTVAFQVPAQYRPNTEVYVPVDLVHATNGRLHIYPNGNVNVEAETSWANAQQFTSLEGVSYAVNTTGFTPLSLQNGWTNAPFSTRNAAVKNDYGMVRFEGAIATPTSNTNMLAFTLPPGWRPATNVYVPVDLCLATKGRLNIGTDGSVVVQPEKGGTNAQCFTSLEGASFALTAATPTGLTLQNGWTNAPFGTRNAALVTDRHVVQMFGAISTTGTNTLPFTLPPEFRPSTWVFVPVDMYGSAKGRLNINPATGEVTVQAEGSNSSAFGFTSLEGVSYALY